MMVIEDIVGYGLSSECINKSSRYLGYLDNSSLKNIGFVEVITGCGMIGVGETYAGVYCAELIPPVIAFLKKRKIAFDIANYELISSLIFDIPYVGRNGLFSSIASGINIAILDILSKEKSVPLYSLFTDSPKQSVQTYASNGSSTLSPSQIADDVKSILDIGFDCYKMRVGYQDWNVDLKRVETAREILGNNKLMIDAIMGTLSNPWNTSTALSRLSALSIFSPYWFEEPLHPTNIAGMSELNKSFPIAGGEALSGMSEFDQYLLNDAVTFIQPDVTHCGSFNNCLEVISKFKRTALHVWGSSAALLANLHIAIASDVEYLEYPMMELVISNELLVEPLQWNGSKLLAPTQPGLGIKLTDEIKTNYRLVSDSNYRI